MSTNLCLETTLPNTLTDVKKKEKKNLFHIDKISLTFGPGFPDRPTFP